MSLVGSKVTIVVGKGFMTEDDELLGNAVDKISIVCYDNHGAIELVEILLEPNDRKNVYAAGHLLDIRLSILFRIFLTKIVSRFVKNELWKRRSGSK